MGDMIKNGGWFLILIVAVPIFSFFKRWIPHLYYTWLMYKVEGEKNQSLNDEDE